MLWFNESYLNSIEYFEIYEIQNTYYQSLFLSEIIFVVYNDSSLLIFECWRI